MDSMNVAAQLFHTALQASMLNLKSEFPDVKYSIGNAYNITFIMIDDPAALGKLLTTNPRKKEKKMVLHGRFLYASSEESMKI